MRKHLCRLREEESQERRDKRAAHVKRGSVVCTPLLIFQSLEHDTQQRLALTEHPYKYTVAQLAKQRLPVVEDAQKPRTLGLGDRRIRQPPHGCDLGSRSLPLSTANNS